MISEKTYYQIDRPSRLMETNKKTKRKTKTMPETKEQQNREIKIDRTKLGSTSYS